MKTTILMSAMARLLCAGLSSPAEAAVSAEPAKILIAYYSYGGNTRAAAEQIQKATGGDIFEIKPVNAYPADYRACVELAKEECASGFKPELTQLPENAGKYDLIFVGTPNWCGTMAPPVLSFLAAHDFGGKTIAPFVTHGGGGVQNCVRDIRKAAPKAAFTKAGVYYGSSTSAIRDWVNETVTVRR